MDEQNAKRFAQPASPLAGEVPRQGRRGAAPGSKAYLKDGAAPPPQSADADSSPIKGGRSRIATARHLRRNMTPHERLLWSRLRGRQLMGFRFRRQVPIGPYVVDFACLERRLIIELDGSHHGELDTITRDLMRTAWLRSQGFEVLHIWNIDLTRDLDATLTTIVGQLTRPATEARKFNGHV